MPQQTSRGPINSGGRDAGKHVRSVKDCARAIRELSEKLRAQKQEEQQLRLRIDYLAFGQEITRTGTWAWSPSSGDLYWSREHFRIFGLDPARDNVSHEVFFRMVHPQERVHVEEEFRKTVRAGRAFEGEFRIVRPDGVIKHIYRRGHPVFGERGKLTEYVGTVADITERRHSEEPLDSMQAEVARASRAMTLRQLTASIAHEVNQPLAAVVANANAALRWLAGNSPRIGKARQALSRIVRDGNRASEIIVRIRALLRRTAAEREPLSLNSVVQEVIGLLRTELRRSSIVVCADLAANLPAICGDRVQMQQVLLNLIMNAIESMSAVMARSRFLEIATVADATGVEVSVGDRGTGVDERVLDRIFEPFYTTKPQGMGIGLAICRSIVEAHGGRLWAVRNAPVGATFRFRLPVNGAGAQ